VFLIQTSGVRLWEIGNEKMSVEEEMKTMIPGLDVRILQRDVWKAQDITSFELRPGDLLYLPPRTIHCGTAVSDHCMTLSVGCRTPAASELTSRVVELLSSSVADYAVQRYVDHDLLIKDASNGLLSKQVRDRMKQLVLDAVHRVVDDDLIFDEIVGRLVTEPKRFRENYPITWEAMGSDCPWDSPRHALEAARQGTGCFFRAEGISFAFSKIESTIAMTTTFRLYADGEVFELEQQSQDEGELATRLLAAICISPFDLDRAILDHLPLQGESLLEKLLVKGYLYVAPEDDEDYDDDEEEDS
jgi:50S ribosomal protein L16 3-hydroxylase